MLLRNLGVLTSLRLGHDNAGLTPHWLVEHVLIRNEFTGTTILACNISTFFLPVTKLKENFQRFFWPALCENPVWFGVAPSWVRTQNHSMPLPPPKLCLHDSSPDPDPIYLSSFKSKRRVNEKTRFYLACLHLTILFEKISSSPVNYFMLAPRKSFRMWIWQKDTRNLGSGSATLKKKP